MKVTDSNGDVKSLRLGENDTYGEFYTAWKGVDSKQESSNTLALLQRIKSTGTQLWGVDGLGAGELVGFVRLSDIM